MSLEKDTLILDTYQIYNKICDDFHSITSTVNEFDGVVLTEDQIIECGKRFVEEFGDEYQEFSQEYYSKFGSEWLVFFKQSHKMWNV